MYNCTYDTGIDYEVLEDFWCNLTITKEELEQVDLEDFELNIDYYIYLEHDDTDDEYSVYTVRRRIDFED